MATIAVDLDDTLYSFCDEAREQLSLMIDDPKFAEYKDQISHTLYASWDQWRSPFELCGEDSDGNSIWLACIARCHDDDAILRQKPFPGAVETLEDLHKAGHKLLYISNRATETEGATATWLWERGFPIGDLIVTSDNKKPFVAECQYMIDDRSKTMVEFVYDHDWYAKKVKLDECRLERDGQYPRKGYMLVAEHNKTLTDVPGLYLAPNWSGLRRYMVKHGLLAA